MQLLLDHADQESYVLGRAGPEYKTMPSVCKVWVLGLVDQLVKNRVNVEACKASGKEAGLLLAIASDTVCMVASLDLCLAQSEKSCWVHQAGLYAQHRLRKLLLAFCTGSWHLCLECRTDLRRHCCPLYGRLWMTFPRLSEVVQSRLEDMLLSLWYDASQRL